VPREQTLGLARLLAGVTARNATQVLALIICADSSLNNPAGLPLKKRCLLPIDVS